MANRIITKALAGLQDLVLGKQTVVQARYYGNVNIEGIYAGNLPYDLAAGESIRDKIGKKAEVVLNIAAMQAIDTNTAEELYAYVMGYTTATDGGGGLFWLDASDTSSAEDLKYIFNPNNLTKGRWKRVDAEDQLTNDNGDASITLAVTSNRNQLFATNFTANRTVTLQTTGLYKGKTFKIIRTNTSAYTLTLTGITPNVVLAASESATAEVTWDGTAWQNTSKTVQIVNTASLLAPYDPAKSYFAHESSTIAMTVTVDSGRLMHKGVIVTNTQQVSTTIVAPVSNPRIDRLVINERTGVLLLVAGNEAASPVAPAIPLGYISCCKVLLSNSPPTTAITNSLITEERYINSVPASAVAKITTVSAFDTSDGVLEAVSAASFPANATFDTAIAFNALFPERLTNTQLSMFAYAEVQVSAIFIPDGVGGAINGTMELHVLKNGGSIVGSSFTFDSSIVSGTAIYGSVFTGVIPLAFGDFFQIGVRDYLSGTTGRVVSGASLSVRFFN